MAERPIEIALVGAGIRGAEIYGELVRRHPAGARVVAIAEVDADRRARAAAAHGPAVATWASGEALLERPRLADAVIIATPDSAHAELAVRAIERGYHLLLEKPIGRTRAEVLSVAQAAARAPEVTVTVAHVLRYTEFFRTLKRLLADGRAGRLVGIQHTENVAYWHFAHSFVRGNWRRADEASPMILAKACHDLDLVRWFADAPATAVGSMGRLAWFRADNAPPGSTARCTDGCAVERSCPYSAVRFYTERHAGSTSWPVSALGPDCSPEGVQRALREGPYGRCVYRCDNDVVDHQVATIDFANGVVGTLVVSALTALNTRTVKLTGSHGEIRGHLEKNEIEVHDFTTGGVETIQLAARAGAHSGGDQGLIDDFLDRLGRARAGQAVPAAATSLAESIESHLLAFAAERARLESAVVAMEPP
ncbi:MAG TPA: Gfo/Idh/MocA family oxidoreductase [Kofleriaceae bacterium]|nr:Gfo/Idh/MocA family oxidoreductase [Kofleriaceae bacterium]